jgi:hypothetical protein
VFHSDSPCPTSAQQLSGKVLNLTYAGMKPHIVYNGPGDADDTGGDFNILGIVAKKHNFDYVSKSSKTFGWRKNQKTGQDEGALYHVRNHSKVLFIEMWHL